MIMEMERKLSQKATTDEEQDAMLQALKEATVYLKDKTAKQDEVIAELTQNGADTTARSNELEAKLGEMSIKGLEGGGGGGGGDPASSAEMKNIISILRADRANIDRLTKEVSRSKEQLSGLEEKNAHLKGEIAQRVTVQDVKAFAQKHDLEEVTTIQKELTRLVAGKADQELVKKLMDMPQSGPETASLATDAVFNDEEMQIRKAINANSAVVQNLSRNVAQLTLNVANKAENDSVEMLQQLLEQLRNKVNRPPVQFGDTEGNAKADIEALKKNVTNLFKQQRQTDAQQSAEIHVLTKGFEVAKQAIQGLEESGATAIPSAEPQPGEAGQPAVPNRRRDSIGAGMGGSEPGPVPETLVADVAQAVSDVFWEKFKKLDNVMKRKVDREEMRMILAGRGHEVGRDSPTQIDKRGLVVDQMREGDEGISNYYITSTTVPSKVPQAVRKYAGRSLSPPARASDPNFKLPNIGPNHNAPH